MQTQSIFKIPSIHSKAYWLRITIIVLLLLTSIFVSIKLYQIQHQKQDLKNDCIELLDIKYGLFNADSWKEILVLVISRKIESFDLDSENKEKLKKEIAFQLTQMLNELEKNYYSKRSKSLGDFLQSSVVTVSGIFSELRENIPAFSESIVEFMNEPANRAAVKQYILDKVDDFSKTSFAEMDYRLYNTILNKYGQNSVVYTVTNLELQIESLARSEKKFFAILVIIFLLSMMMLFTGSKNKVLEHLFLTAIAFVFLWSGLSLPMIEIDARISHFSFTILDEQIIFDNQLLFYKSKSILEIVKLMLLQNSVDLVSIGILIFLFSVLFPVLKLLFTIEHLAPWRLIPEKMAIIFIFYIGKWSMADVFVVAIFMAYLGFTGIISEQLHQLESLRGTVQIFTSNASSLQTGFWAFLVFVLFSMSISIKLAKS
jgi:hypothetical protein